MGPGLKSMVCCKVSLSKHDAILIAKINEIYNKTCHILDSCNNLSVLPIMSTIIGISINLSKKHEYKMNENLPNKVLERRKKIPGTVGNLGH